MSTSTKPVPNWTGDDMVVTVPNFLADAWDASGDFATAFLSVYQQITEGYEKAASEGRLPTTHDVVVEEGDPQEALRSALLRGEGRLGSVKLAAEYGCCRQTVARVAADMGLTHTLHAPRDRSESRVFCEALFADGETRPRVILAALCEAGLPPVKRNTITQWRLRFEGAK